MKVQFLKCYPNPYTLIHRLQGTEDGVTWAGTLPLEPNGPTAGIHGQIPRYVGCQVDTEATKLVSPESTLTVGGKTATTAFAQHDVAYKYDTEPTLVPNTAYYRSAVFANDLTGHSSLVAADLATARVCGISSDQYKDPLVLLEELRSEAIKRFAASNSDIEIHELESLLPHVFTAQKAKKSTPSQATNGGQS